MAVVNFDITLEFNSKFSVKSVFLVFIFFRYTLHRLLKCKKWRNKVTITKYLNIKCLTPFQIKSDPDSTISADSPKPLKSFTTLQVGCGVQPW